MGSVTEEDIKNTHKMMLIDTLVVDTKEMCDRHKTFECFTCLKLCVDELMYNTKTAGNGGFVAQFGLVLYDRIKKLTTSKCQEK